jgi:vacuolar protein sorting-associated protein 41
MSSFETTGLEETVPDTTRDVKTTRRKKSEPDTPSSKAAGKAKATDELEDEGDEEAGSGSDESEDDEDDEEPKLKYQRRTKDLGSVYRNGDAVSSSLVAGDKMVCSSVFLEPLES